MTATTKNAELSAPLAPRRVPLHVKSAFFLMGLLIAAVAICGFFFNRITESTLQHNQVAQAQQLGYAIAAILGNDSSLSRHDWQGQLNLLDKTPHLRFAVLTDENIKPLATFNADDTPVDYTPVLDIPPPQMPRLIGVPRPLPASMRAGFALSVPVFSHAVQLPNGRPGLHLMGYLILGMDADQNTAQLHYLKAYVLMTCMAVVLLAIPIATLIARHITGPIKRLAGAAHALGGDLTHRVSIERSDEIGDLAQAFNTMAERLQAQQSDIRQINAGLEAAVQARTAELEKVNGRLQAEIAEKEDFLRAVSHDLNAPLRNISGMASMLILKYQATLEKDALQRLERIQKNVEVESALINELLELSRIKSRREKIENVDLHDLLCDVADQFSNDFETREITFKITSPLPVMRCEKSRLRQLFQNFIDNAVKYMRPEGSRQITVDVTQQDTDFILSFADTGMGIAAEDLPNLFHIFRRAKNASMKNIPGKGVGLASVKSIVENYNGYIRVESKPGVGTTFFVSIPSQYFCPVLEEVPV